MSSTSPSCAVWLAAGILCSPSRLLLLTLGVSAVSEVGVGTCFGGGIAALPFAAALRRASSSTRFSLSDEAAGEGDSVCKALECVA